MALRRTPLVAAAGVAALAAGVLVTTSSDGATEARWHEASTRTAPSLTMGTPSLTVTDVPAAAPFTAPLKANLTNGSGFGLEYQPTQLKFTGMPGTPTVGNSQGASAFLSYNTGVAFDYWPGCTVGTAPGRWNIPITDSTADPSTYAVGSKTGSVATRDPLVKGTSNQPLCLVVRPDMLDHDRYMNFAGREFQLTTTVKGVSVASTWTTTSTWVTRYVIPVPSAMLGSNGDVCETSLVNNLHIYWAWPDAGTSAATSDPGLNHWVVYGRLKGSSNPWVAVHSGVVGTDRDQYVSLSDMANAGLSGAGDYEFVVRGYPFASDTTRYSESAVKWYGTRPSGTSGYWTCGGTASNPGSGMYGY